MILPDDFHRTDPDGLDPEMVERCVQAVSEALNLSRRDPFVFETVPILARAILLAAGVPEMRRALQEAQRARRKE